MEHEDLCVRKEGRVLVISHSLLSLTDSKYYRTTRGVHDVQQAFTGLCQNKSPT